MLFVLCDSAGYAYQFDIYNGAGDNVILDGAPDLGATSNEVVRLSKSILNFAHHIVYFDNVYISLPLLVYLRARGIYGLGTFRPNRVPHCKLPTEKETKGEERLMVLILPMFREEIAGALVSYKDKGAVDRPPTQPSTSAGTEAGFTGAVASKAKHPVQDIRLDLHDHFGIWLPKTAGKWSCIFCKMSKTQYYYEKLSLHLCNPTAKNCFYDYHHRDQ
ncbi:unnamed protein product [Hermetia illucens]|uniref:PiggyBac transposable element-derived protein domain-containing protein n=1 Tax=Hermetia illucens TaxID=343691 RepID=A0A7R8UFA2_HERIL|nr:unnamed protein product [Hermetia illucens]